MNTFDLQLKSIVNLAENFAKKRESSLITTLDLLAGILLSNNTFAKEILTSHNITLDDIEKSVPTYSISKEPYPIITPLVDEILFETYEIAENLKCENVTGDHLLLSILMYDTGYVKHFLKSKKLDPYEISQNIIRFYGDTPEVKEFRENLFKSNYNQFSTEKSDDNDTKSLNELCINMNEEAKKSKYTNAFTRDNEIIGITNILSRRTKNNVCLIGEPGVGKTAIVEGLVNNIVNGNVPYSLKDKIVYSVNMGIIIAGTKYRGEFEDRLQNIVREASENPNIILFIDEIHTLVGTGGGESSLDAANILKPALARGDIQIIGATTFNEYKKFIEKDGALERRFNPLKINEPSVNETTRILEKLIPTYEKYHEVNIPAELCNEISKLADRYINDRYMPDKAIDLLDEACVVAKNKSIHESDKEVINNEKKVKKSIKQSWKSIIETDLKNFQEPKTFEETQIVNYNIKLFYEDILKVLENWTGIPVSNFKNSKNIDLLNLNERLNSKVIGQNEAVSKIVKSIKRSKVGLSNKNRPIGSFLFCGNTGVGKTYLAKVLAEEFFNSEKNLITIDMTEYMESHSISKLIGSPPGYVGYEDKGQLTEKVRKSPYSVILFDEIEKAHPNIFNILLRILDEGKIDDSSGREINFRNTIIILTSNIGNQEFNSKGTLGFGESLDDSDKKKKIINNAIKQKFKPEFINRLDEILIFNSLSKENLEEIVKINFDKLRDKLLTDLKINFKYKNDIIEFILNKNINKDYGAREINRLIQSNIEDGLTDFILNKPKVKSINCSVKNNNIYFTGR